MRIVAILGSPHGSHGTTGKLLDAVLKSAERAGAMVACLPLGDYEVGPCLACDACHKTGSCRLHDHVPELKNALQHADGIVLASPNYMFSVSAQLKALMDRCCGPLHCQSFQDKHAAAIVTSGGPESAEVGAYLERFLQCLGCWTVGSVGAAAFELGNPQLRPKIAQAAADLGRALCDAIRQNTSYPQQRPTSDAFFERMKQLVTFRRADWPYEYEHWKAKGWLKEA
jgi:multimeric flavodoxin WrbA